MKGESRELVGTLNAIEANQRRFTETRSLRKQYRLCIENERLFARLGIRFPPMRIPRGLYGWWLKRGTG